MPTTSTPYRSSSAIARFIRAGPVPQWAWCPPDWVCEFPRTLKLASTNDPGADEDEVLGGAATVWVSGSSDPTLRLQPLAGVDAVLVDRSAAWMDLEVQVAAGGVAEAADLTELLARPDQLAVGHADGLHVRVPGGQPTLPGAHLDEPRPRPGLVPLDDDGAGARCADRRTAGSRQVGAGVATRPVPAAVAEVVLVGVREPMRQSAS